MSKDDLEPLPLDLQNMLRQGRPGCDPPRGSREAVLSFVVVNAGAVAATVAVHAAVNAAQVTSAVGRGALHGSWGVLKGSFGIGGLMVGAAVGAAGHAAVVSHNDAAPPIVATHSEERSAPSISPKVAPTASSSAVAEVLPPPSTSTPAVVRVIEEPRANDAKDTSLGSERALIDMARTAVARGQGDVALAPLERHGREFPHGRLAEERDWLWVQALVLTKRTDEAGEHAARFRRAYPRSLMLPALDRVLPSAPPP